MATSLVPFRNCVALLGTHAAVQFPYLACCALACCLSCTTVNCQTGFGYIMHLGYVQQQQQTFKVWQPQRAARSKRPNTPSDGSKHNGFQTTKQTNKQKFKVRQPQRAAKSKRPNAPSDGSKNNGIHTTKQEEYPSRHPTTDTANSSTSKQITSRRLIGVSKPASTDTKTCIQARQSP